MSFSDGDMVTWTRLMFPYGTALPLIENGFLEDPDSRYPSPAVAAAKPLSEVRARTAVVVGQSGLGKSHALRAEADRLNSLGQHAAYIDLRGLGAQEAGEVVTAALENAGQRVSLLIDSLDEVVGTEQAMIRVLSGVFDRLAIRIEQIRLAVMSGSRWIRPYECQTCSSRQEVCDNCRSTGVYGVLGTEHEKLMMAPLTEEQARRAAATDIPDVEAFISAVVKPGIGPIAAYPVVLKLLLRAARDGQVPRTRMEAYQLGTQGLAAGADPATAALNVPLPQRLAAARRLAVATVLSGARQIGQRGLPGADDHVLSLDNVSTSHGTNAAVTDTALDAVYASGLLQGGTGRRGWTHRSVEDFLCAEALQALPRPSVEKLLFHPRATDTLHPRFAGVAAWLAALDHAWFDWLLERRYELLFNHDLHQRSTQQKRRLAAALIRHLQDDEPPYFPDPGWTSLRFFPDYTGLHYDGLGDDLAPLLADAQPIWRQREAVHVILATGLHDLDPALITLIETSTAPAGSEDYSLQLQVAQWAAIALRDCTDPALVDRAKTVLGDGTVPWPVRAEIAAWLWPRQVSTHELGALIPAAERSAGGNAFARRLGAIIADVDLHVVELDGALLRFIVESPTALRTAFRTSEVATRLCLQVLRDPQSPLTAPWTDAVALTAAHLDDERVLHWTAEDLMGVPAQHRQRFAADVAAATSRPRGPEHLTRLGLAQETDLVWWLNQAAEAHTRPDATAFRRACQVLSGLAATATHRDRVRQAAVDAARADAALGPVVAACFSETALPAHIAGSPAILPPSPSSEPPSPEQITDWIAAGQAIDRLSPWRPSRIDWATLTPSQRAELAAVAQQHLCSPDMANASHHGLAHVITAHGILTELDRNALADVQSTQWLPWLTLLITAPDPAARTVAMTALSACVSTDPAAADPVLMELLANPAALPVIRKYTTPAVSQMALDIAATVHDLDEHHLGALLECAAAHRADNAANLARTVIRLRHEPAADARPNRRAVCAAAALTSMPSLPNHFSSLLAELQNDSAFARQVIAATRRAGHQDAWRPLQPEQLGELFLWANNTFPDARFPPPGVSISSNTVEEFADRVLDLIGDPSNPTSDDVLNPARCQAAITTLRQLAEQTGNVYIKQRAAMLRDASLNTEATATATDVLAAIDAADLRIVTTAEQLVDALVLALDDLAHDLQHDRAVRAQFWNRQRPGSDWSGFWVPMEENDVSTWLSRQLKHYLRPRVALFREVEINQRLGATSGDRLDIMAIALETATHRVNAEVLIEVKCNWNGSLTTALDQQLAQRYLQGPHGSTGLYLVAYFRGTSWATSDSRRSQASRLGLSPQQLAEQLTQQASALRPTGAVVHVRILDLVLDD